MSGSEPVSGLSLLGMFFELTHSPTKGPQKLHTSVRLPQPAERFRRRRPKACPIICVRGREETANSKQGVNVLSCIDPVSMASQADIHDDYVRQALLRDVDRRLGIANAGSLRAGIGAR